MYVTYLIATARQAGPFCPVFSPASRKLERLLFPNKQDTQITIFYKSAAQHTFTTGIVCNGLSSFILN